MSDENRVPGELSYDAIPKDYETFIRSDLEKIQDATGPRNLKSIGTSNRWLTCSTAPTSRPATRHRFTEFSPDTCSSLQTQRNSSNGPWNRASMFASSTVTARGACECSALMSSFRRGRISRPR